MVIPSGPKAGLSLASISTVAFGLMPVSWSARTSLTDPSFMVTLALIGTISDLKYPFFCAAAAFLWELTANSSRTFLSKPYLAATLSEVLPIGIRQFLAVSWSKISSASFDGSNDSCMLYRDMLSTPHPRPISMIPALILAAMMEQASIPEEHCLFTATTVAVYGIPDNS